MATQWEMMKRLTMANAISGDEKATRIIMREYMEPYADTIETDKLGSLIAIKNGVTNGPKIMIAGHLDEIGFIVSRITEEGYLKFQTIGGWWGQNMLAQRVTITTREGKEYIGIIGSIPPHALTPEERNKPANIQQMFIDLGVDNKSEVEKLGIRQGDAITPYFETQKMANDKYLLAKAWDNRVGCLIAIEVLKQLKGEQTPNTIYSVATVQEEVGRRGAETSSYKIQPDIGFSVDVTLGKTLGTSDDKILPSLGQGPALGMFDAAMLGHRELRYFVEDVAKEEGIPVQLDIIAGGATDGSKIHLSHEGAPTINISIPSRYIHSNVSIIHQDDVDNAIKLIVAVCKKLDQQAVEQITYQG